MSLDNGVRSVERDIVFPEMIIITFLDGSNQILDEDKAHDLFIKLGEVLNLDWHS